MLGSRGAARALAAIRPFSSSSSSSSNSGAGRLAGRNIFELRAVPQANAATTSVEEVQAASPPTSHNNKAAPTPSSPPAQEAFISLPTSDESDTLLRIRHSVSGWL
jgi:hypothetical protein